jgi:hypothetical protein
MQIVGRICKVCHREIIFAAEGKLCTRCKTFVHHLCESRATCPVCGLPFEEQHATGTADLVVPSALRSQPAGPMWIVLVGVGLLVLIVGGYYALVYVLAHGH